VSFGFLFLSPFLGEEAVRQGWYALALWRVGAVAGLLYSRRGEVTDTLSLKARRILHGCLHSLPFWGSSLFFPLRVGQAEAISRSLLLFLALTFLAFLLSFLKTHWLPGLVVALTYCWFHQDGLLGAEYLPVFLAVLPALWPRRDRVADPSGQVFPGDAQEGFDDQVRVGTVLASAGWALCLYFNSVGKSFGLSALSHAMLLWMMLSGASAVILHQARRDRQVRAFYREAELALPALELGLEWLYFRQLKRLWGPWLLVVPLAFWGSGSGLVMVAALVSALVGLLALARGGRVSEVSLQWWCTGQFVIFWGVAETPASNQLFWVAASALLSLYLFRIQAVTNSGQLALCTGQAELERRLRAELKISAPQHHLKDIINTSEPTVEIEDSLVSAAPTGFRERLLKRLRQTDSSEEVE
jgi:hypothetical protein